MPLDGCEDLSVGRQRFLGASRCLQGLLPDRLQHIHDRGDEPLEGRVVGGLTDSKMKGRIGVHTGPSALDLLFLLRQDLLEAKDVRGGRAGGSECGDARLNQQAHLKQIEQGILTARQQRSERGNDGLHVHCRDEGAAAAPPLGATDLAVIGQARVLGVLERPA